MEYPERCRIRTSQLIASLAESTPGLCSDLLDQGKRARLFRVSPNCSILGDEVGFQLVLSVFQAC